MNQPKQDGGPTLPHVGPIIAKLAAWPERKYDIAEGAPVEANWRPWGHRERVRATLQKGMRIGYIHRLLSRLGAD